MCEKTGFIKLSLVEGARYELWMEERRVKMSAVGALFREVLSKMENDPRRVGFKENVDIFLWKKYNLMVRIMEFFIAP